MTAAGGDTEFDFGMAEVEQFLALARRDLRPARPAGLPTRITSRRKINAIVDEVVDAAFKLHTDLGPGMLESTYERILRRMLVRRGLKVERQLYCDFIYDGLLFTKALRLDLFVEETIVIELKAEPTLQQSHHRQVVSYLSLLELPLGLLINFGSHRLKHGFRRVINPQLWQSDSISGSPVPPV